MVVELTIALVVLAIATGLTLKMHQARLDYDRASFTRLQHRLIIENIAEQLAVVSYADMPAAAARMQADADPNIGIQIAQFELESETRKGWHVTISASTASGPLSHHVWRLESSP